MIMPGTRAPTSSACNSQFLRQVGCGLCAVAFEEMVLHPFRQSRVPVVIPRVLAVLPSSSSSGENIVCTEHSLTVLSEQELEWLQSGVVFPQTPAPKK